MNNDQIYLRRAIELAEGSEEEVGCGCVIVDESDIVIGEAFNSPKVDQQAVNHAEIKTLQLANTKKGTRKLANSTAYCSCEPCAMCLTALSYAKIPRIVFYKSMKDYFPSDPQSNLDSQEFVQGLNFVPKLEQLSL